MQIFVSPREYILAGLVIQWKVAADLAHRITYKVPGKWLDEKMSVGL